MIDRTQKLGMGTEEENIFYRTLLDVDCDNRIIINTIECRKLSNAYLKVQNKIKEIFSLHMSDEITYGKIIEILQEVIDKEFIEK